MNFTQGDLEEVQERLKKDIEFDITKPIPITQSSSSCSSLKEAQRLAQINKQLQNGELLVMMANEENRYKGGQSLESTLMPAIKIKYHDSEMPRLKRLPQGDWIDLINIDEITLNKGDYAAINLGVSMELPQGYEAHLVPRSSTFKKWGLLQVNSPAIIDNSFCGDDDVWHWLVYATKLNVTIPKYTRLCQFRIVENQSYFPIVEVETLGNESRGGVGSTGE